MLDSLEIIKRLAIINDNGPIYNEFIHDGVIHEPWNAYSSLFFFLPIIFWIWKLKGQYNKHLIIVALLPLLFLNGVGSTLFHAFRNQPFFLVLDWLPAALMSITLASYFWTRIVGRWYKGLLIVLSFYGLSFLSSYLLSHYPHLYPYAPNLAYLISSFALFLPLFIYLYRTKFEFGAYILLTILFLGLALLCRTLDYPSPNPFPELLPQGTHFMWHVFSSFAVFSLGFFIYRANNKAVTTAL